MRSGQCSAGYHDGGNGRCVVSGTCVQGYHDNGVGGCALTGCAYPYYDDGAGKCVAVGCAAGFHDDGTHKCVVSGCAAGYHNGGGGPCISYGCSGGYYDNGSGFYDDRASLCLQFPAGCTGDGGCNLALQCISGFHNGGNGCVPIGQCSGMFYDNGSGVCVTGGGWWSDVMPGTCRTELTDCVAGDHNGGGNSCVPAGTCSAGYYLDGTGACCIPPSGSDAGMSL